MKSLWRVLSILSFLFVVFIFVSIGSALFLLVNPPEEKLAKNSILYMKLEGVIMDADQFLEDLRDYRKEKYVKGVLVRIDSPGGVVAPSQEIYEELKRVREVFKKPIVVSGGSLVASGAYYAAVAADKIVVNSGSMVGSIGVLLEFVNLEKLYDWAKVQRYALTTGEMKDAGAEYKPLTPAARQVYQNLINNVYAQFLTAVRSGRKIDETVLRENADGRVVTGEQAVKMGFADQVGTFDDAVKVIGGLAGLGDDPHLFEPPKKRHGLQDYLMEFEGSHKTQKIIDQVLRIKTLGAPLYLLPGVAGF